MKKKDVREPDEKKIAALVRQLLVELGEDPDRDLFRVVVVLLELSEGKNRSLLL